MKRVVGWSWLHELENAIIRLRRKKIEHRRCDCVRGYDHFGGCSKEHDVRKCWVAKSSDKEGRNEQAGGGDSCIRRLSSGERRISHDPKFIWFSTPSPNNCENSECWLYTSSTQWHENQMMGHYYSAQVFIWTKEFIRVGLYLNINTIPGNIHRGLNILKVSCLVYRKCEGERS